MEPRRRALALLMRLRKRIIARGNLRRKSKDGTRETGMPRAGAITGTTSERKRACRGKSGYPGLEGDGRLAAGERERRPAM
jgi:hypothetical protein